MRRLGTAAARRRGPAAGWVPRRIPRPAGRGRRGAGPTAPPARVTFWTVTRVTGHSYQLLTDDGGGFPLGPGEPLRWAETLCHHVGLGNAPRFVPDVSAVPSLTATPIVARWDVAAYLKHPAQHGRAHAIGTVCEAQGGGRGGAPAGLGASVYAPTTQRRLAGAPVHLPVVKSPELPTHLV